MPTPPRATPCGNPSPSQIPGLLELARKVAAEYSVSCVLGMGSEATLTRLLSPLLGCPFTYGFLGEGAVAPGQLPAARMRDFFSRAAADASRPSREAPVREWWSWADALLERVRGV
jgi:hypothetical protein